MLENIRAPITEQEVEDMIKDADPNNTGFIDYNGNGLHV